jgi:kynurenine formamidase
MKKWEKEHGEIPSGAFVAMRTDWLKRWPDVHLSTSHYQIELLTNLDQVPEAGAIAVVSFPKPKGASGFPARVFAILS